jgi:leader peptidase (prepilin peptidase) / N-methyltransferase
MEVLYTILFGLLGLALGSFLNVCIDRLPGGGSILHPTTSQCQSCHRRLMAIDLIPLFSYLWLRGRCRYCQATIPRRLLWVELASGMILALLYHYYGLSDQLAVMAFYAYLFLIIFVVDLEWELILNKVVYPGIVVALLIAAFLRPPWLEHWLLSAAIGGGIGLVAFLLIVLISRGGMGWGDVKLATLIGLASGFPLVLVALIMGALLGGIVAAILLVTKKRRFGQTIPMAPHICVAAMVTLLWGSHILDWYTGLL